MNTIQNNPQTPDNEVARLREENADLKQWLDERYKALSEADDEVARLREEAKNWHQHYRNEASKAQKCKQAYIEQEKEVARLREELDRFKLGCQGSCYACEPVGEMNLKLEAEVARLREMVMDAARRGDEMNAHWKERAENAEAIIKQLHHYAGIIEGFQTTTNK